MKFTGAIPKVTAPVALPKSALVLDYRLDNGHWSFPEQMGAGAGFIYVIYDTVMRKAYLGRKAFKSQSQKSYGKDSDWRKYKSSSNLLEKHFLVRPKEEFEFICIEQYNTRSTLAYAETWSLCKVESPVGSSWYNGQIEKVAWPVRERITDRHKSRLQSVIERLK